MSWYCSGKGQGKNLKNKGNIRQITRENSAKNTVDIQSVEMIKVTK